MNKLPYLLFLLMGGLDLLTSYVGMSYFGLLESNDGVVFFAGSLAACLGFWGLRRLGVFRALGHEGLVCALWVLVLALPVALNSLLILFVCSTL